jgi:hypothetical protein
LITLSCDKILSNQLIRLTVMPLRLRGEASMLTLEMMTSEEGMLRASSWLRMVASTGFWSARKVVLFWDRWEMASWLICRLLSLFSCT